MKLTSTFSGASRLLSENDNICVATQVEVSAAGIVFNKPCLLKIPHFAGDPNGEKHMFIAALQEPDVSPDDGDDPAENVELTFEEVTENAVFNIGTGYSTSWITKPGTFYVCSRISDGVDYAVTSYSIQTQVPGTTFNAVAFDWIEGEASLWARTSLDRPPGKDGPIYVRRRARLTVDVSANRISGSVMNKECTFPETFLLSNNYNLLTGMTSDDGGKKKAKNKEPFDTAVFQIQIVPAARMEIIEEKTLQLEEKIKDLKVAEEQAEALGQDFEAEAKQPYLDAIQEARLDLKETRQACLPWKEKTELPAEPTTAAPGDKEVKESDTKVRVAHMSSALTGPLSLLVITPCQLLPFNVFGQDGSVAPGPPLAKPAELAMQTYRELPAWEGKDMTIVFGSQMIPDNGFQEDHLTLEMSLVAADKDAEPARLLEVPEMPEPGGRFKKVWVGPEKNILFSYPPVLTRASYAELTVSVRLGSWTHKCTITLSTSSQSLADVRTIVQSHCYGRDLSEARFVMNEGQQVQTFSTISICSEATKAQFAKDPSQFFRAFSLSQFDVGMQAVRQVLIQKILLWFVQSVRWWMSPKNTLFELCRSDRASACGEESCNVSIYHTTTVSLSLFMCLTRNRGNAKRPNIYKKNNVVLSFTSDLFQW
jgi:hypothetical protein